MTGRSDHGRGQPLPDWDDWGIMQPGLLPGNQIIFISGDPGSGKSTLGKSAAHDLGYHYVSTGDLLRTAGYGSAIRDGNFGPDDVVYGELRSLLGSGGGGYVVDGFPRRMHQVEQTLELAHSRKSGVHVIWVSATPEVVLRRYEDAGAARCPRCSKYGPALSPCVCGGSFEQRDIPEHYAARRGKQEDELRDTLGALRSAAARDPMILLSVIDAAPG